MVVYWSLKTFCPCLTSLRIIDRGGINRLIISQTEGVMYRLLVYYLSPPPLTDQTNEIPAKISILYTNRISLIYNMHYSSHLLEIYTK